MRSTFKEGRAPLYDSVLKIAIAREYLQSKLGYGKLAHKHGLSMGTVRHFVRWYRARQEQLDISSRALEQTKPMEQKELQQANLKITALELLIENASKELGMDLIKKFGTKQSGK
jgi:transposase-like protein